MTAPTKQAKKAATKLVPRSNVIIPPVEGDGEAVKESDVIPSKPTNGFVPLDKEGNAVPQNSGKYRKLCPSCGLYISGAVTKVCPNPACAYEFYDADGNKKQTVKKIVGGRNIVTVSKDIAVAKETIEDLQNKNKERVIAFLVGRGFKFREITDYENDNGKVKKVTTVQSDPKIEKLNLQYTTMGDNDKGAFVTASSPMIKVTVDFDTFLQLAGIKA